MRKTQKANIGKSCANDAQTLVRHHWSLVVAAVVAAVAAEEETTAMGQKGKEEQVQQRERRTLQVQLRRERQKRPELNSQGIVRGGRNGFKQFMPRFLRAPSSEKKMTRPCNNTSYILWKTP